jgi:hypothetical protein
MKDTTLQIVNTLYNHMQVIDQSPRWSSFLIAAKSGPHVIVVADLNEAKKIRKKHKFPRGTSWVSLNSLKGLRGHMQPVLFSPEAMDQLLRWASIDLHKLQEVKEALV